MIYHPVVQGFRFLAVCHAGLDALPDHIVDFFINPFLASRRPLLSVVERQLFFFGVLFRTGSLLYGQRKRDAA